MIQKVDLQSPEDTLSKHKSKRPAENGKKGRNRQKWCEMATNGQEYIESCRKNTSETAGNCKKWQE